MCTVPLNYVYSPFKEIVESQSQFSNIRIELERSMDQSSQRNLKTHETSSQQNILQRRRVLDLFIWSERPHPP